MDILMEISENLQKGKAKAVKELVSQAVEQDIPAGEILEKGLMAGMDVVGEKFKNNQVYVTIRRFRKVSGCFPMDAASR